MGIFRKKIGKQGTWFSAIFLLISPLLIIFSIRWLLYEPFVIPSGSMKPNLLVHDHIIVEKFSYGVKLPIGDGWLFRLNEPKRGDVVVFRYPQNRNVFFIKRLIGLPGDRVKVQNGQITVNEQPWIIRAVPKGGFPDEEEFNYYLESVPKYEIFDSNFQTNKVISDAEAQKKDLEERIKKMETEDLFKKFDNIKANEHIIKLNAQQAHVDPTEREFIVPKNAYFVMGDNRDQSQDSRFWGFVPGKLLIGRASFIWLSCENTLPTAPMLCDPEAIRRERLFKRINDL